MIWQHVTKWDAEFQNQVSVNQWCSAEGRPKAAGAVANITHIREWMTTNELKHDLNLSYGTVSRIIVQLDFIRHVHNGSCKSFLRTTRQREGHMPWHSCNNTPFTTETFWNALSAVHYSTPEPNCESMECEAYHEPGNLRSCHLLARWRLPCFRIRKADQPLDFLERGATTDAAAYSATLEHLPSPVRLRHLRLLTQAVLLLHGNICQHTAASIQELFQHFWRENLDHPLNSPDLALSDFHLFPSFKEHSGDHRTQSDEDVKQWWHADRSGQHIYETNTEKHVLHLDICLGHHGRYVGKNKVCIMEHRVQCVTSK